MADSGSKKGPIARPDSVDSVGLDEDSSFKLECRIVAHNCRFDWYSFDKIVDADCTHFAELLAEIVDKFPLQITYSATNHEDSAATIQTTPRRKMAIAKKLTPKKLQIDTKEAATPSSPASNTRSKKKLQVD